MNDLKTFRVLMAETHSQYYEVLAENEDQACERAYSYDADKLAKHIMQKTYPKEVQK